MLAAEMYAMRPGRTSKTYSNQSFPDLAPALCGATTGHRPRRACRPGQGNDGPISTLRVLRERSNRQAATALIAYADWRAALGSPVLPRRGALHCSCGTPPGNLPDRRPKAKNPIFSYWCGREDSNLHGSPRYHLKVVRLPNSATTAFVCTGGITVLRRIGLQNEVRARPLR